MDADAIMAKQLRQMEKEKKEKDLKLKTQEKKVILMLCAAAHLPWSVCYFLPASCSQFDR